MIPYSDFFGRVYYSQVQGSGFVYNFAGQNVIITNSHVIEDAADITVTFANGNAYSATVLGSDPYAELAVLSADAPEEELLKVTDPKIVEKIMLNRQGKIQIQPGYDGEYGYPIFSEKDKKEQPKVEIKKKQTGLNEFM